MKLLSKISAIVVMTFGLVSNADTLTSPNDLRVLNFKLFTAGSTVAPEHSANFRGGTATINYELNTVKLTLNVTPKCPVGSMCTAVLRMKVIELPIVAVTSDNECFVTVQALKDGRIADGLLQEIKIDDYSKSSCDFNKKPVSNITYLTSYVDRINGNDVTTVSTLKADSIDADRKSVV